MSVVEVIVHRTTRVVEVDFYFYRLYHSDTISNGRIRQLGLLRPRDNLISVTTDNTNDTLKFVRTTRQEASSRSNAVTLLY